MKIHIHLATFEFCLLRVLDSELHALCSFIRPWYYRIIWLISAHQLIHVVASIEGASFSAQFSAQKLVSTLLYRCEVSFTIYACYCWCNYRRFADND